MAGKKVFSKLDLCKGYFQVPVAQYEVPKTAVITPIGLIEFLRMPFGLRNARQFFQHFMDEVLDGLNCIFVYLDGFLVASNTKEEHKIHLEEVFKRLQQHGLALHLEKCVFFTSSVEFLGQHVSTQVLRSLGIDVSASRPTPGSPPSPS